MAEKTWQSYYDQMSLTPLKRKGEDDDIAVPETYSEPKLSEKYDLFGKKAKASRPQTVSEFREDPDNIERFERVMNYLNERDPSILNALDIGNWEDTPDMVETLRDDNMRIGSLINKAMAFKEAPEEIKQDYSILRERFNKSELTGVGEWLDAITDYGTDIVASPEGMALLGSLFFSAGTSAPVSGAAYTTAQIAARQSLSQALKKMVYSPVGKAAMFSGAEAGMIDLGQQNLEVALDEREDISLTQTALMTSLGATFGGAITYGIQKGAPHIKKILKGSPTSSRTIPEEEVIRDFDFNFDSRMSNSTDIVDVDNLNLYDPKLLPAPDDMSPTRLIENLSAKITNKKVDPEDLLTSKEVEELVSNMGGGARTAEELVDEIIAASNEGSVQAIKNKIKYGAYKLIARPVSRVFYGKAAGLLSPYTEFSPTAKNLQQRFSYEFGKTFDLNTKVIGQDFKEVKDTIMGKYFYDYKSAVESLAKNKIEGTLDDATNDMLHKALHGQKVNNKRVAAAALKIKNVYRQIGEELQDMGLISEPIEGYVPRVWDREAIVKNRDKFASLLLKHGEAKTMKEASDIVDGMLSKKDAITFAGEANSYGPLFMKNRVFENIADEADFASFINNDVISTMHTYLEHSAKAMAKKKVFGVMNETDFANTWVKRITQEVQAAGGELSQREVNQITDLYRVATGEGLARLEGAAGTAADVYSMANRFAYLSLATISSIPEIGIMFAKNPSSAMKGLARASQIGIKRVFGMGEDEIKDRFGLTVNEYWREMQKVGVALEHGSFGVSNRLAGDDYSGKLSIDATNKFFKLTLLDQWTKFVESSAFAAGKNLIYDNATKLAAFGDKPLTKSAKRNFDELVELGVNPDDAIGWINRGASRDDKFYDTLIQGAGRFAKATVLQPTAASGQKSFWMSHPVGNAFFQLLSYPAAFTNTVLKGFVKQVTKGVSNKDMIPVASVAAGGYMMLELGRLSNAIRTWGESEKEDTATIYGNAMQRIGGFGLLADTAYKAYEGSTYTGNPIRSTAQAMTGPLGQDLLKLSDGKVMQTLASKLPGQQLYPETAKELREKAKKIDSRIKKNIRGPQHGWGEGYATGGVVNVPNAPAEPDERIDKMTGLPYNQQAGTAYVDAEERSGFALGGLAKMTTQALSKVIRDATEDFIDPKYADQVATKIYKELDDYGPNYRTEQSDDFGFDDYAYNDMPMGGGFDPLDQEYNDYIQALTYSQLREKTERTITDLQDEFGDEIGGELFSKSRGYTDEEIQMNEFAMELMDEIDPDGSILSIVNANIDRMKKAYGEYNVRAPEDLVVADEDKTIFDYLKQEMMGEVARNRLNPKKLDDLTAIQLNRLKKDDNTKALLDDLKQTMAGKTKLEDMPDPLDAEVRQMKIDKLLTDSGVKVPLYRMTSAYNDLDYDIAFSLPKELGAHFGTSGQANFIGLKNIDTLTAENYYSVPARGGKKVSQGEYDKEFFEAGQRSMETERMLGEAAPTPKLSMVKGYANIKNPLVIEHDMGSWDARDFLMTQMEVVLDSLQENGVKLTDAQDDVLGEMVDRAFDMNLRKDDEFSKVTKDKMKFNFEKYKLNRDFRSWLESLGFDSIKYRNNVESSLYGEDSYSYILFKPQQFKVSTARLFDFNDPRMGAAEGGEISIESKLAKFFGLKGKDIQWAKELGKRYGRDQELDGKGDAARHLALGWLASRTENPKLAKAAIDAREYFTLEFNTKGREMDFANNAKGATIMAKTYEEAEKAIQRMIDDKEAVYYTPDESRQMRGYATGGRVIKSGDTLSAIAREAGTTVEELAALNNIENPDMIYAGQKLVLPSDIARKEIASAPQQPQQQSAPESEGDFFTRTVPVNVRQFLADLAGNDRPLTEKELSPEELAALKSAVERAKNRGSSRLEYEDYATGANQYADVGGGASSGEVAKKIGDPSYALKTTIGQARIEVDDDGNVIVRDRYNFNDAQDKFKFTEFVKDAHSKGLSLYGQLRNIGKWFGSGPKEGSEVVIHLGKLDTNKKQTLASVMKGDANYVIKEGDSLSTIAKDFGTSVDYLMAKNKIKDPNKIYIGDVLKIA